MAKNGAGYTGTAKFLHWLIVVLLAAQFIVAWTMPHIGRNTPVTTLISLHFTIGIVILAVAAVRLVWRLVHGEPTPAAGVPPWQIPRDSICDAAGVAGPGMDQRVLAEHADRDVRC